MKDITGITVSHNTLSLLKGAYESVRRFHPDMKMIIIDGSTRGDPCQAYARSIADENTDVYICNYNIGHGRGMHMAIKLCDTRFALIFDSDIVMIKSPVQQMLDMMESDTLAVGYMEKTGYDGFEYGAKPQHRGRPFMYMMHPFFHLLQVKEYFKYQPYVHHGAPCYKQSLDVHLKGLTDKVYKRFPDLGHTSGKGWVWDAIKPVYVIHDTAGTRKMRRQHGLLEIEGNWER